MMRWIGALYSDPTAQIQVNGTLSEAFKLHNGTRQGCPLSPLLFVLSLEPLLTSIRKNREINGIKVGEQEHKIAAYADDIMLFIANPRQSLPKVMEEMDEYGKVSNFKINMEKTEILNIDTSLKEKRELKALSLYVERKGTDISRSLFISNNNRFISRQLYPPPE